MADHCGFGGEEEAFKVILVLNFFLSDDFAATFNRMIRQHLEGTHQPIRYLRITAHTDEEEFMKAADEATHLILSGSEASTLDDRGWEDMMCRGLEKMIRSKKAILGICYGHQLLVRCLAGKAYLRKAPYPEMGWGQILLEENPLFAGITHPVCLLAHYDEAIKLPEDFQLLGRSEKCPVHAFQYKDLPVWGVQFHPEYDLDSGREIFDELEASDPLFFSYFINELDNPQRLQQNKRFFTNFIHLPKGHKREQGKD